MVKILQYGEGNFLRTFVDVYFDTLNKNGQGMYAVNIVKPITFGTLERFEKQGNKYHIVLRGMENGQTVENVYKVDSLEKVIDPFVDYEAYIALAHYQWRCHTFTRRFQIRYRISRIIRKTFARCTGKCFGCGFNKRTLLSHKRRLG